MQTFCTGSLLKGALVKSLAILDGVETEEAFQVSDSALACDPSVVELSVAEISEGPEAELCILPGPQR